MIIDQEVLEGILDAYPYEVVFVDLTHTVRYMNAAAKRRYEGRVFIGSSLFNCHNERAKVKIEAFLERAENGEGEMFELYNGKTGEREFFTPVRNQAGEVIGYFERHETPWDKEHVSEPVGDYWKRRTPEYKG
ncbi:MAG: PAS domain-containing protein [Solobacterium sp.]|nr:PAS domain-containing protein [Solobacterium sp.]